MRKIIGYTLLLSGFLLFSAIMSLQAKEEDQQKQSTSQMPSTDEMMKIMEMSEKLKPLRPKVAVSMRRITIQMAALIDADAKYHTTQTMKELIQELSDRLRTAIDKYELGKNVKVILFYPGCDADDVTSDFIKTMFPYPVRE